MNGRRILLLSFASVLVVSAAFGVFINTTYVHFPPPPEPTAEPLDHKEFVEMSKKAVALWEAFGRRDFAEMTAMLDEPEAVTCQQDAKLHNTTYQAGQMATITFAPPTTTGASPDDSAQSASVELSSTFRWNKKAQQDATAVINMVDRGDAWTILDFSIMTADLQVIYACTTQR